MNICIECIILDVQNSKYVLHFYMYPLYIYIYRLLDFLSAISRELPPIMYQLENRLCMCIPGLNLVIRLNYLFYSRYFSFGPFPFQCFMQSHCFQTSIHRGLDAIEMGKQIQDHTVESAKFEEGNLSQELGTPTLCLKCCISIPRMWQLKVVKL